MKKILLILLSLVSPLLFMSGCSSSNHPSPGNMAALSANGKTENIDSPVDLLLEEKILSLDPENISARDVMEILSRSAAPQIINLNGSLPVVKMGSFSRFLILMGYPDKKILNPEDKSYSYSSHVSSEKLAGIIAWYYERDGLKPMLIGHSQGGMMVVKVLHEFDGAFHDTLYVYNPFTGLKEERDTITDPLSGREQPVSGLTVGFASAIGTGTFMRLLLGQWNMISRLRKIPDTADEFTGYHIPYDLIGSDLPSFGPRKQYEPAGSVPVRNVTLPSSYSHISVIVTDHLAENPPARQWIENYLPESRHKALPAVPEEELKNIYFAADIWYQIKKNWSVQLQRIILDKRKQKAIY